MGFFGELKQDLSLVAGNEKKKEKADAEADRILADAEIAGLDEAESVMKQTSLDDYNFGDDGEDVAALLKDLVSDLGSEEPAADKESEEEILFRPVSDDVLADIASKEESAKQEEIPDDLMAALNMSLESIEDISAPESAAEDAVKEEAVISEPASEDLEKEEPAAEDAVSEEPAVEDTAALSDKDAAEELTSEVSVEAAEEPAAVSEETAEEETTEEETAEEQTADIEEEAEEAEGDIEEEPEEKRHFMYIEGADEMEAGTYSDETSVITAGMVVNGDVESLGSLDLFGKVAGDVTVKGKLNVTGHIIGNSEAKEVFAENAKITGNIVSESSVKIGAGTVIVGNISAFSAAIAGAVKGDIDVHGPVILDSTAIVMGNIRSKSVQINNGAALEGICSQAYAEVSPTAFFDDYTPEKKPEKKSRKKTEENA